MTNDQRLVGNLRNVYETSKLEKKWNSKVIQDVRATYTSNRYDNKYIYVKANINSIEPSWMEKFIHCYCSLKISYVNSNIPEWDNNVSLGTLARTQTIKTQNEKHW